MGEEKTDSGTHADKHHDHDNSSPQNRTYLWTKLGNGAYNKVWKSNFPKPTPLVAQESYRGPWVLKYPIKTHNPTSSAMNNSERSVRVWNEINAKHPKAGLHKKGWVAPFFANTRPATDSEIAEKLLEIYRDTKRIVIDAATKGNVITVKATGEVILVDVDLALKRTDSKASLHFSHDLDDRFARYWNSRSLKKSMPKTLEITRNLLFLEDNFDVTVLPMELVNLKNVQALTWFRDNKRPINIDILQQIVTLNESGVDIDDTLLDAISMTPKTSTLSRPNG